MHQTPLRHAQALQKLLRTKTLKDFRAAHNALEDAGAKVVAECLDSELCAIERLSLVANGIGTKGFEALASSQRNAAAQLHIAGNLTNLDWDDRVEAAARLSQCFRLMDVVVVVAYRDKSTAVDKAQEVRQALRDGHVEIFWKKREGRKELAAALQGQSRLQVLQIEEGKDVEAVVLEALEGHVALKSLVLVGGINGSLSEALGIALDGRSGLEELVLKNGFINPERMQALAPALKGLAALKVLDLASNKIGPDGAKALAESLTGMSLLERLHLQRNKIGSEGAEALVPALKGLAALKFLGLGDNGLGDDGAKALAPALKGLAALKDLYLSSNDLRDDGVKALAESLTGMSLLEQLVLYGNKIGSEGAQVSKALRSGKQLRRQALAPALKGLAALKVFDLDENDLGDDGVKARRGRTTSMSMRFLVVEVLSFSFSFIREGLDADDEEGGTLQQCHDTIIPIV
ncbi:NLRC3 [Symbiodinium necroappetens]|uniref:NLRC3 protein n=1 Tax=Symbiodinium necroappetens TaxID=1628268 RepID=A0A812XTX9_9DINO|nr:NLRC3 [Symbiodinium necroappetens]